MLLEQRHFLIELAWLREADGGWRIEWLPSTASVGPTAVSDGDEVRACVPGFHIKLVSIGTRDIGPTTSAELRVLNEEAFMPAVDRGHSAIDRREFRLDPQKEVVIRATTDHQQEQYRN